MKRNNPAPQDTETDFRSQPAFAGLANAVNTLQSTLNNVRRWQQLSQDPLDEVTTLRFAQEVAAAWMITSEQYAMLFGSIKESLDTGSAAGKTPLQDFHNHAKVACTQVHRNHSAFDEAILCCIDRNRTKKRRTQEPPRPTSSGSQSQSQSQTPSQVPPPFQFNSGGPYEVKYTDLTAEVNARLAAREARNKLAKLEGNRKRSSRDSLSSINDATEKVRLNSRERTGTATEDGTNGAEQIKRKSKRAKTRHGSPDAGDSTQENRGTEEAESTHTGNGAGVRSNGNTLASKRRSEFEKSTEAGRSKRRGEDNSITSNGHDPKAQRRRNSSDAEPDQPSIPPDGRGTKKRRYAR
ncbi:hypothetical protein K461DRAFT_289049 [Myriangium duriaei CBS 260.36]|uniref:Uncharacterized protein n=1 Tax=Myriangium duriaei CBS 260.36 TaxID=1168546 RepID=A0A9P4J791_9PEZI|nr:hypothetical protein K461DRAFT_289049 [Myriangium duriaei CBS 260.36]